MLCFAPKIAALREKKCFAIKCRRKWFKTGTTIFKLFFYKSYLLIYFPFMKNSARSEATLKQRGLV